MTRFSIRKLIWRDSHKIDLFDQVLNYRKSNQDIDQLLKKYPKLSNEILGLLEVVDLIESSSKKIVPSYEFNHQLIHQSKKIQCGLNRVDVDSVKYENNKTSLLMKIMSVSQLIKKPFMVSGSAMVILVLFFTINTTNSDLAIIESVNDVSKSISTNQELSFTEKSKVSPNRMNTVSKVDQASWAQNFVGLASWGPLSERINVSSGMDSNLFVSELYDELKYINSNPELENYLIEELNNQEINLEFNSINSLFK